MDMISNDWLLILIAAVIVALLAFLLLRPRQRVRLSDSAPLRPHMAYAKPAEGRGLAGEAAAATSDVTGQIIGASVRRQLDGGSDGHDDLCRLKGVGPRFAEALQAQGFHRFDQIAGLSDAEVDRLDTQLGAFRGRIARDRIVEQADYLSRDDIDGYEQKFGKL